MNREIQGMMAEMEDMKAIKKTLTSWLKEEASNGKECFDTKSCGAVSDIVKDMAETVKACYEAMYYKTVIEAMTERQENPMYGYNHRHMANGEFAGSGMGRYVRGYNPGPYMDQMPYVDAYMHDPNFEDNMMGYSAGGGRSGGNGGSGSSSGSGGRSTGYGGGGRSGYSRDGEIYDNYRMAKRYYHESKSVKDKEKMDAHCMMYMDNTLKNLRAMWKDADPKLKERLKADFGAEMADILEGMG